MLRPNSRSCRTASIRSGRAGGLAGELRSQGTGARVGPRSGPAAAGCGSEAVSMRTRAVLSFMQRAGGGWKKHSEGRRNSNAPAQALRIILQLKASWCWRLQPPQPHVDIITCPIFW